MTRVIAVAKNVKLGAECTTASWWKKTPARPRHHTSIVLFMLLQLKETIGEATPETGGGRSSNEDLQVMQMQRVRFSSNGRHGTVRAQDTRIRFRGARGCLSVRSPHLRL